LCLPRVIDDAYDEHRDDIGCKQKNRCRVNPEPPPDASKRRQEQRSDTMNSYPPARINPLAGVAAIAMSALTFALAVGVPSSIAPTRTDATLAAARSAPMTGEIAILPPIEVIAVRDTTVANRQSKPRV